MSNCLERADLIKTISDLYPADSIFPVTAAFGKQFLSEAVMEGLNWRNLPIKVLEIYAKKCGFKESEISNGFNKKFNQKFSQLYSGKPR